MSDPTSRLAGIDDQLKVFNNQHPFHNELELIDSQRRTLIGDGRFEIPGRRAGMMARQGLVDIVEAQFGKELSLTAKGKKQLREGQDEWSRTILASKTASKKSASRYHLPGKKPGTTIEFGVDRVFGRFFQYWPTREEAVVDEDRLTQGEIIALMKQYGRPGADLDKATGALMMDLEPSKAGLRPVAASQKDDLLPYERAKAARFTEGPAGEKEWKVWFNKQPKEFQREWESENKKHRDQFEESMMSLPYEEACGLPMGDEEACGSPLGTPGETMMEKTDDAVLLPVEVELKRLAEEHAQAKEAAGGLYGYTKQVQSDVEATVRKAQKHASQIARALHARDERAVNFLQTHAKRARSSSARLLLAAMHANGLRVASDRVALDADEERLYDRLWLMATNDGRAYAKGDAEGAIKDAYMRVIESTTGSIRADYRAIKSKIVRDLSDYWAKSRTAAEKTSGIGMYGFPSKTARMCLSACTDLRAYVGEVAYDLHARRTARWGHITGFMREHAKTARCGYSRMLLGCYPDNPTDSPAKRASSDWWVAASKVIKKVGPAEVSKVTKKNGEEYFRVGWSNQSWTFDTEKEALGFAEKQQGAFKAFDEAAKRSVHAGKIPEALKEHQFTSEDNPNPKGNDKDGDGKTNEKKPFKEAAVSASDIKPGDEVMVGKFRGKVERVRDVDAWVELDHGASWVPLKNITLPSGKKAENRNKTMRDQIVKSLGSGATPEGSVNVLSYKGKEWKVHWPRLEAPGGDLVTLRSRKDDEWLDEALQHIKGGKKADFDPNEIAENETGALTSDSNEPYMKGNFTEQETSELSDKMAAAPNTVAGWLEWQE